MSAELSAPLHLLDSEKRLTVFKEKPLTDEPNHLRSKFKDKIERQNWTIKLQAPLDQQSPDSFDPAPTHFKSLSNQSFTNSKFREGSQSTSRLQLNAPMTRSISHSHFNLGYL